jgi:hypothetical protein
MTESEWLTCIDPGKLIDEIAQQASERKLQLFACACCRSIWHLLPDDCCRRAVELAESHADGQCTEAVLLAAARAIYAAYSDWWHDTDQDRGEDADEATCAASYAAAAAYAAYCAAGGESGDADQRAVLAAMGAADATDITSSSDEEKQRQAALVRDVFANPFHSPPNITQSVLAWGDGVVLELARCAYDRRDFTCLPLLADTLAKSGCTDDGILDHCRQARQHVRGCWVIDLLLRKGYQYSRQG